MKNICRECWAERVHYGTTSATGTTAAIDTIVTTLATDGTVVGTNSTPTMDAGNSAAANSTNTTASHLPVTTSSHTLSLLLSVPDKEMVKQGLIHALLNEHEKSLRDLLAETLQTIVIHDFPQQWTHLIPTLLNTIAVGLQQAGIVTTPLTLSTPSSTTTSGINNQNHNNSSTATTGTFNGLQIHNALLAIRKVTNTRVGNNVVHSMILWYRHFHCYCHWDSI